MKQLKQCEEEIFKNRRKVEQGEKVILEKVQAI